MSSTNESNTQPKQQWTSESQNSSPSEWPFDGHLENQKSVALLPKHHMEQSVCSDEDSLQFLLDDVTSDTETERFLMIEERLLNMDLHSTFARPPLASIPEANEEVRSGCETSTCGAMPLAEPSVKDVAERTECKKYISALYGCPSCSIDGRLSAIPSHQEPIVLRSLSSNRSSIVDKADELSRAYESVASSSRPALGSPPEETRQSRCILVEDCSRSASVQDGDSTRSSADDGSGHSSGYLASVSEEELQGELDASFTNDPDVSEEITSTSELETCYDSSLYSSTDSGY